MIPKECKRLIEVDFPIAEVSKQSAREKSIRHGHPSTLHLWWARRPLAACRSVLLGLLLPDPCDEHCPEDFKTKAREILPELTGGMAKNNEELRSKTLKFVADFSNWDHSSHPRYLAIARGLVKAAHPEDTPLVADTFAGGGSIPLEALRLGCDAFASDLNPVACLINKVLLEDIPRHGKQLAEELRRVGAEIKVEAEKELAEFYPLDSDGSKPVTYLWARIVTCESPNCGAEVPLIRSFWLFKKDKRKSALRYKIVREKNKVPRIELEIFQPKNESDIQKRIVERGNAVCPCCETVLSVERVREQLIPKHGGADDARLLAVITLNEESSIRNYRLPTEEDYKAIKKAQNLYKNLLSMKTEKGISIIPDEPTPLGGGKGAGRAFSQRIYGMNVWADLFTVRQNVTLSILTKHVRKFQTRSNNEAVSRLLAFAVSIFARSCNTNAKLRPDSSVAPAFGFHAIPMSWDFPELTPWGSRAENFDGAIKSISQVVENLGVYLNEKGTILQADARKPALPYGSAQVWFTDPPYYDAIPYAELSDFFFVWLKRSLINESILKDPFDNENALTPKLQEAVVDDTKLYEGLKKDAKYFESTMAVAFGMGRNLLQENGISAIVFAHKTTEGWEALLGAIIKGGLVITASWPITTESAVRLRARDSAALAASIHLICRAREENTEVGDWSNILRELPNRIGDWMERLDKEGVHGADLVFSCIGPALELFSRYDRVETAEGRTVELAEYLEKVWEVVGRTALEQILGTAEARARNGAAGVLEEDARLTALFLWTLMSTAAADNDDSNNEGDDDDDVEDDKSGKKKGGYSLQFDVARRFAQPLGIDLEKWKGRVIEIEKGVVRLLSVKERALQLFGEKGSSEIASKIERSADKAQIILFPEEEMKTQAPSVKASRKVTRKFLEGSEEKPREATTLDRVHAAMLLQASGKSSALKALIEAEQKRSPDFVRLSNALSALYPKNSEEKRLLDAMLLAVPRR